MSVSSPVRMLLHESAGFFAGEGAAAFDDVLEVGLERHRLKRSRWVGCVVADGLVVAWRLEETTDA